MGSYCSTKQDKVTIPQKMENKVLISKSAAGKKKINKENKKRKEKKNLRIIL
jgi:hypothetical protein